MNSAASLQGETEISPAKNAAAALFVQGAVFLSQLLVAPILVREWGVDVYSTWIKLLAIPLLLAQADLGLGAIAANRAALLAVVNPIESRRTFNHALRAICLLAGSAAVSCYFLSTAFVHKGDLLAQGILALYGASLAGHTFILALARNSSCNPSVLTSYALCKILEVLVLGVLCLASSVSLEMAAGTITGISFVFIGVSSKQLRRELSWFAGNGEWPTLRSIGPLLRDGMAAVAFPGALALSLQWPILVASAHIGALQIAQFSTLRTLARIVYQQANVVSSAFWGRYLALVRRQMEPQANAIASKALILGLTSMSISSLIFFVAGPTMYKWWLGGSMTMPRWTFALLLVQALISGIWLIKAVPLAATNRYQKFSYFYLVLNVVAFLLMFNVPSVSLNLLVATAIVIELLCLVRVTSVIRGEHGR